MAESAARSGLIDYVVLKWAAEEKADSVRPRGWGDRLGLSSDGVTAALDALSQRGLMFTDVRLAGTWCVLQPAGRQRLAELAQPSALKRTRVVFLRDTWIAFLYAQDATGLATRFHPADHFGDSDFALAEPTSGDHEAALAYLEDKGLIQSRGSMQDRFLFVWLTAEGIDCAERGDGISGTAALPVTSHMFVQHNNFTNVAAAAVGRDGVSATGSITNNSITNELRALVEQIGKPEDREEGLLIVSDAEDADQQGDDSKFKLRLRQLLSFAGRLTERGLAVAIEALVKGQLGM